MNLTPANNCMQGIIFNSHRLLDSSRLIIVSFTYWTQTDWSQYLQIFTSINVSLYQIPTHRKIFVYWIHYKLFNEVNVYIHVHSLVHFPGFISYISTININTLTLYT